MMDPDPSFLSMKSRRYRKPSIQEVPKKCLHMMRMFFQLFVFLLSETNPGKNYLK